MSEVPSIEKLFADAVALVPELVPTLFGAPLRHGCQTARAFTWTAGGGVWFSDNEAASLIESACVRWMVDHIKDNQDICLSKYGGYSVVLMEPQEYEGHDFTELGESQSLTHALLLAVIAVASDSEKRKEGKRSA